MDEIEKTIDEIKRRFDDSIASHIDRDFVENKLSAVMKRLKEKQDNGEKFDLIDLRDCLLVIKNVLVPSAMRQEVEQVDSIRKIIHGSMGIS